MAYPHSTSTSPYLSDVADVDIDIDPAAATNSGPPYAYPSHQGSYHNSPYSDFASFDEGSNDFADISIHIDQPDVDGLVVEHDYDPADYDAPGDNALYFDNDDFIPNLSPDLAARYDHSSPASSAGDGPGQDQLSVLSHGQRSRASSVSSNHGVNPALTTGAPGSRDYQSTFEFENMTFNSPSPGPQQLWSQNTQSPTSANKPMSPPALYIPGPDIIHTAGTPSPTSSAHSDAGAGANRGGLGAGLLPSGPGIHIVPATPVSGGGANGHDIHSFQDILGGESCSCVFFCIFFCFQFCVYIVSNFNEPFSLSNRCMSSADAGNCFSASPFILFR